MSKVSAVSIYPGRTGYKVQVDSDDNGVGYSYHYVTDVFDLHQTIDRLFPPQKPESLDQKETGK